MRTDTALPCHTRRCRAQIDAGVPHGQPAANNKARGVADGKTAASVGSKKGWSKIFSPFRKLFGKGDRKAPAPPAPSKTRAPKSKA